MKKRKGEGMERRREERLGKEQNLKHEHFFLVFFLSWLSWRGFKFGLGQARGCRPCPQFAR